MNIDSNAPVNVKATLHVVADRQTTFDVISDIGRWPTWNPDVSTVSLLGPVQPGTVFIWKSGAITLTSKLQQLEAPTEIGWTGTTTGVRAVHVFRLHPDDHGGTLISSEESWNGLPVRIFRRLSRKILSRSLQRTLTHLKTETEKRVANTSPR